MFCRHYNEAIQELVEGTLGPVRRAELQTHLDTCDTCRALAADLQKIRDAGAALPPLRPPDRVWERVAGQLRQEGRMTAPPAARTSYTALLAIAATLVIAIGGGLFILQNLEPAPASVQTAGTPEGNATPDDAVQSITDDLTAAERHYQSAIQKLEAAVQTNDGSIAPELAAVLEKNLPVIDQAIAESRSALQSEPQSAPARDSLFEALRQKVNLLQDTIALMNEMRKGNSAAAAQIVDGSKS
jgi:anti-sigma factor RsiW